MNLKALLIEKERVEYIGGNVGMAMFLSNVLDYVIGLEGQLNTAHRNEEELQEKLSKVMEKLGRIVAKK